DRSHIFFGRYHLDLHDRFKQDRLCLFNSVLERKAARDMKRTFVRIDFVIRTENESRFDIDKLISGEESATQSILNTFGNRLDELTRDRAARDLVFEYEAFARSRFDLEFDVAELAAAARLF